MAGLSPLSPVVSAVVLAAGLSSRMEGRHKLLLDVEGEPMLRRVVRAVLAMPPAEVVVVTGYRAADVMAALEGLPVRFAHNEAYAEGQPGSVVTGIRALTARCDAVMIVLGDQPKLTAGNFRALRDASLTAEAGKSIFVPFSGGARGNPVMFAAHHIPELAAGGRDAGPRRLIDSHPALVAMIDMADDAFVQDCDTPADYAALLSRHLARAQGRLT